MNDNLVNWIALIIIGIVLLILFIRAISFFYDFSQELKYLNTEIRRTHGRERKHYIRKRRRLWLSLIPFVKYRD